MHEADTYRSQASRGLGYKTKKVGLTKLGGCDIILVNADGRVVESGDHAQLMQQKGVQPGWSSFARWYPGAVMQTVAERSPGSCIFLRPVVQVGSL